MEQKQNCYGSGIAKPKIDNKDHFELKDQFLKELRDNTFSGSNHEDANEHIEKVLEIVDLFHVPNITQDQIMLRVFPIALITTDDDAGSDFVFHWIGGFQLDKFLDAKGITRITGNGKNVYELKGKFLDALLHNAFSGTNGEDTNDDQEEVVDEGFSDAEEAINDNEQEIAKIFIIERNLSKTYEGYENELNDELEEPWSKDGVP
ncbi:hypothetical protein Tco_0387074 [Tanacetum coccineum]